MNKKAYAALLFAAIAVCIGGIALETTFSAEYPVRITYHLPSISSVQPIPPETVEELPANPPEEVQEEPQEPEERLTEATETAITQFPLELNACTQEELMVIPRVGYVTATRILQYREYLGGYTDISQLLAIKGIGTASFETISAYVYVQGDTWDTSR